jgi:hypothetical protein
VYNDVLLWCQRDNKSSLSSYVSACSLHKHDQSACVCCTNATAGTKKKEQIA